MARFSFLGPVWVEDHFELRIRELRDFYLGAATLAELYSELKPAVDAYLASLADEGVRFEIPPENLARWQAVQVNPVLAGVAAFEGTPGLPSSAAIASTISGVVPQAA